MIRLPLVLALFAAVALVSVAGCSDDDDGSSSSSSSSSTGGTTSSSSSSSSSGGSECTKSEDCAELTCTCGSFAGTKVTKCTNGVCAKSCAEAGCT